MRIKWGRPELEVIDIFKTPDASSWKEQIEYWEALGWGPGCIVAERTVYKQARTAYLLRIVVAKILVPNENEELFEVRDYGTPGFRRINPKDWDLVSPRLV